MKLLKLEDNELVALKQLMHEGIKVIGLEAVMATAILLQKINNAEDVPEEPKLKEVKK